MKKQKRFRFSLGSLIIAIGLSFLIVSAIIAADKTPLTLYTGIPGQLRSGDSLVTGTRYQFKANANSNDSITQTSSTKITLDAEVFDVSNKFDSSTNYRYTPGIIGYYQFNGCVTYDSPEGGKRYIATIEKNGAEYASQAIDANGTLPLAACVSDVIYLDADDYVELTTYHESSGAEAIQGNSARTFLSGFKID
jgi:hypothetical protein